MQLTTDIIDRTALALIEDGNALGTEFLVEFELTVDVLARSRSGQHSFQTGRVQWRPCGDILPRVRAYATCARQLLGQTIECQLELILVTGRGDHHELVQATQQVNLLASLVGLVQIATLFALPQVPTGSRVDGRTFLSGAALVMLKIIVTFELNCFLFARGGQSSAGSQCVEWTFYFHFTIDAHSSVVHVVAHAYSTRVVTGHKVAQLVGHSTEVTRPIVAIAPRLVGINQSGTHDGTSSRVGWSRCGSFGPLVAHHWALVPRWTLTVAVHDRSAASSHVVSHQSAVQTRRTVHVDVHFVSLVVWVKVANHIAGH